MTPADRAPGIDRRSAIRGLAAIGIGTTTGAFAHGFLYGRQDVEITRETLTVSGLPPSLSGLRLGFLSDTHRSRTVAHELIDRAVRMLLAEQPDLIVLGGDYVTWGDRRYVEPAAEALAPLTAPHGVFAVLGNHDDDRDMPAALAARGFTVLRDQRTQAIIRGEKLEIAGIRYWTRQVNDLAYVLRGATPNLMLLAHTPARLVEASALGVPLVLSGHTHGGQVAIRGERSPARSRRRLLKGLGRQGNTQIYVNRGLGTVVLPIRYGCPPEISLLELRA